MKNLKIDGFLFCMVLSYRKVVSKLWQTSKEILSNYKKTENFLNGI